MPDLKMNYYNDGDGLLLDVTYGEEEMDNIAKEYPFEAAYIKEIQYHRDMAIQALHNEKGEVPVQK